MISFAKGVMMVYNFFKSNFNILRKIQLGQWPVFVASQYSIHTHVLFKVSR